MLQRSAVTRLPSFVWLLSGMCIAPVLMHADFIQTQVSCSTGGQSSMTGANTCSVAGTGGYANDNLQLRVINAVSASDYTTVLLSEIGVAHGTPGSYNPGQNGVLSSASLKLAFSTGGPDRPGYIEVTTPSTLDTEWGVANLSYSIGAQDGSCYLHTSDCTFGSMPPVSSLLPNRFFAFELGDPSSVELSYSDSFATEQDSFISPISGSFELQFRFFEADGTTPVAVTMSPEPDTWGLSSVTLLVAAFWRLRSRLAGGK